MSTFIRSISDFYQRCLGFIQGLQWGIYLSFFMVPALLVLSAIFLPLMATASLLAGLTHAAAALVYGTAWLLSAAIANPATALYIGAASLSTAAVAYASNWWTQTSDLQKAQDELKLAKEALHGAAKSLNEMIDNLSDRKSIKINFADKFQLLSTNVNVAITKADLVKRISQDETMYQYQKDAESIKQKAQIVQKMGQYCNKAYPIALKVDEQFKHVNSHSTAINSINKKGNPKGQKARLDLLGLAHQKLYQEIAKLKDEFNKIGYDESNKNHQFFKESYEKISALHQGAQSVIDVTKQKQSNCQKLIDDQKPSFIASIGSFIASVIASVIGSIAGVLGGFFKPSQYTHSTEVPKTSPDDTSAKNDPSAPNTLSTPSAPSAPSTLSTPSAPSAPSHQPDDTTKHKKLTKVA